MAEGKTNKSKIKKIIIVLIIILMLIVALIGGYFVYQFKEANKNVGTDWGDKYYALIKSSLKDGNLSSPRKNNIETTISFIQTEESDVPKMVVQYQKEENINGNNVIMYSNIVGYIEEDTTKQVLWGMSNKTTLLYLYNIKDDKYMWYVKINYSDYSIYEEYIPLTIYMKYQRENYGNKTQEELKELYNKYLKDNLIKIYKNNDEKTTAEGVYKFDDVFIMIEDDISKFGTKTFLSMPLKDINKMVANIINEKYKTADEIVNDEVKASVANKKEEISNAKKEAERKAAEEAQKKAEEEAAKKAAEKAAKGLKVGKYTVKYGTYKGTGKLFNADKNYNVTLILKPDGTCTYTRTIGSETKNYSGTFYVTRDSWYGIEVTGESAAFDAIGTKWSNGEGGLFAPDDGNVIWNMEIKMKYVGN